MLTIALYGDSIGRGVAYDEVRSRYHYLRDGFARLMEKEGQARFLNHSRFGATAREGLAELEPLTELDADAVVVEYGGNDCSPDWKAVSEDPDTMHPPRTALADFEEILARFVRKIRELGKIAVLVTPPPLVAERFVPWVSKGLDEQAILRFLGDAHHVYRWQEQYALSVHQVARQTRSRLFDLRAWFLKERDLGSLYCADGMHPNQKGHALIARAAADMLPRIWEE